MIINDARHFNNRAAIALFRGSPGSRVAWAVRPPTKAQYERARTAFENEILAEFVILSLRRLVTLERPHDEVVSSRRSRELRNERVSQAAAAGVVAHGGRSGRPRTRR
jgi:hypothetical protein